MTFQGWRILNSDFPFTSGRPLETDVQLKNFCKQTILSDEVLIKVIQRCLLNQMEKKLHSICAHVKTESERQPGEIELSKGKLR